ncbi:MAG: DUF493 domain-containing protein [Gammaproteobacteria bacterium]|nr:DUF493 domain-containing protein [Gammaproteobacteria bacterium]
MKKPVETLIKFPCDFTIKVFGAGTDAFEKEVIHILHTHVPTFTEQAIQQRPSENGKYLALSVTVYVESKKQLDDIYQALSSSPHIIMAL